jgi:hypothetical protein
MKLLALLLPIFLFTTSSISYPFEGKLVFTLKDIIYSSQIIYSTPAHLAVADGHIEFNLTNSAVPYTTHCSGSSEWLYDFFYGNIVYICDAPTGEGVAEGASANFTFSNPAGAFAVNQTWSEPSWGHYERDGHLSALNFLGIGSGNATMNCKTDYWQNANWTIGQLYSTTTVNCKPADLIITPTVVPIQ